MFSDRWSGLMVNLGNIEKEFIIATYHDERDQILAEEYKEKLQTLVKILREDSAAIYDSYKNNNNLSSYTKEYEYLVQSVSLSMINEDLHLCLLAMERWVIVLKNCYMAHDFFSAAAIFDAISKFNIKEKACLSETAQAILEYFQPILISSSRMTAINKACEKEDSETLIPLLPEVIINKNNLPAVVEKMQNLTNSQPTNEILAFAYQFYDPADAAYYSDKRNLSKLINELYQKDQKQYEIVCTTLRDPHYTISSKIDYISEIISAHKQYLKDIIELLHNIKNCLQPLRDQSKFMDLEPDITCKELDWNQLQYYPWLRNKQTFYDKGMVLFPELQAKPSNNSVKLDFEFRK